MEKLEWKRLFCEDRIRPASASVNSKTLATEEQVVARNAFEADYDRIVGSSSVRRLQDKAQVFPLQKDDVVRTRLTHSMEVSALARSLGKAVGVQLEQRGIFKREDTEKLSALLQTTGLIHDLGNPPFGHCGEQIIQEWIEKNKKDLKLKNKQELQDFLCFDGNVQNLRIVTKLQTMNDPYGANFTYATLATLMKYPYKSTNRPDKNKKKFGYFKSEQEIVEKIREKTGLEEGVRHPATLLLEAADDIIYMCDDIEDGVKKGYIDWDKEFDALYKLYLSDESYGPILQSIKDKEADPNLTEEERILANVRVFRNMIQSFLFKKAVTAFVETSYDDIMSGNYKGDLLKEEEVFIEALKGITRRCCFSCKTVLNLEMAGYHLLNELLDIFYKVLKEMEPEDAEKTKSYAGKVYSKISANYKYIALHDYEKNCKKTFDKLTNYDKLHLIVDFISGMTDSYAVTVYQELTGINLPG